MIALLSSLFVLAGVFTENVFFDTLYSMSNIKFISSK